MHLGVTEIILIVVVAILLIKPDKLHEYLKTFFRVKATIDEAKNEANQSVNEIKQSVTDLEKSAIDSIKTEENNKNT